MQARPSKVMKFEVFEGQACGGFSGGKSPAKKKMLQTCPPILHTEVRNQQRHLPPNAHSESLEAISRKENTRHKHAVTTPLMEGQATRVWVSKSEQTQTTADKRQQMEAITEVNCSKRKQTQTNADNHNKCWHPLYCGFLPPPPPPPAIPFN